MRLDSLTRPELIYSSLPGQDRDSVLRVFARRLADNGLIPESEALYDKLVEREQLGSTGIGSGVAIPHCKLKGLSAPLLSIGVVDRPGVDFGAVDGKPVRVFFLVVSPTEAPAEHLQVLAAISRWVKADEHVASLLGARGPEEIYELLRQETA